jgi:hypothetical protein
MPSRFTPLHKIRDGITDKARHDRMILLVEQMLSLHKRLANVITPHDKFILQQQITVTDQQIDRMVYKLYGLTEEEIKTVEDQTSFSVATETILESTPPTELTEQFTVS